MGVATGVVNPVTITNNKVTLKLVDNINPSIPVLVSPENNTYVTTGTPTFIWEQSTDDRGISKYQFYLNGSLVYDNLPTGSSETGDYIYTYDSLNSRYSLKLKNAISDGTYTWKIKVFDINGNSSESTTWTFTVDTLAPTFVISQIGDASVSISAQDPSTVPDEPIELENNEPLIVATGEANSTVVVTVTSPSDPTQTYTTTIDANGDWQLQLGVFTRGETITLDFVITDQAGLVSVISNLRFVVKEIVVVIPPASPTPTPVVTPTPGVTPAPESPSPSPTGPIVEIPITPPREFLINLLQEIAERLPEPLVTIIALIPEEVIQVLEDLAPVSAAIIATALPVASAVAIATQFGGNLSFELFLRLLQSLGLIPSGKPQGMVFNSLTNAPVPFALLTIYSEQSATVQITETVVTDVGGVYRGVKLTPGLYRIVVAHQDYIFPSTKKRPPFVPFKDFYRGEVFNVTSEKQQQLFLIPVDPKEVTGQKSFKSQLRLLAVGIGRFVQRLMVPLFLISGFIFTLFPSFWNGIVFLFYLIMVGRKLIMSLKAPIITGVVVDKNQTPLANAVVRIIEPENNELIAVITTAKNGKFKVFADRGIYHFEVTLPGYIWQTTDAAMSFYQVDASQQTQNIPVVMQPAAEVYAELFT